MSSLTGEFVRGRAHSPAQRHTCQALLDNVSKEKCVLVYRLHRLVLVLFQRRRTFRFSFMMTEPEPRVKVIPGISDHLRRDIGAAH